MELEGSRRLRLSGFSSNRQMNMARFSALQTGRLYPKKDLLYSFMLEAELGKKIV
jgi:hypothetical protein